MPSWQVIQSDQLFVLKHLMKLLCLVVLADMNIIIIQQPQTWRNVCS